MASVRDLTRFYIRTDGSAALKRLVNVVTLEDKSGQLAEYKVTFEGIKGNTQWTLLRNAIGDARVGIRRIQGTSSHQGEISVGYHADGNVMVKVSSNFKPRKYPPLDKLGMPKLFLRVSGFSVADLHSAKNVGKNNEQIITVSGLSKRSSLTCDFYISRVGYGVANGDPAIFESGQTHSSTDQSSGISLHLHIYKTKTPGFYIVVPKTGVYAEIEKRVLYFWYSYVYRVMGWKQSTQLPAP